MIIRAVIEIVGSPKEHVEKILGLVIEKIKKEELKVLRVDAFDAKEVKELWSCFAEVEIEFETLERFMGFCFDYMPSSIEILEPEELKVESGSFGDIINDLLAKLHQYDMLIKGLKAENIVLKREDKNLE
ncbi:hypothetical protein CL618_01200 [archaeon]|jgi:hypothetical protein|nr:hypothetical protein [archaeon]|tara:strand:+ start:2676 stop:3065 length:390 start_codon:yes stop_codon:yes gene_type:complete